MVVLPDPLGRLVGLKLAEAPSCDNPEAAKLMGLEKPPLGVAIMV
jgi:hypothetical protein